MRRPVSETTTVNEAMTVNEVIRESPETVAVFNAFGIDACCGGSDSLAEAAERSGVELGELVRALADAVEAEA